MKKLFRMALVLVLAGSALVYTSCTKDYSPDIKSLQDQIDNLNNGPEGLAWLKTQLQGVQSSLTALEGKVNGEITNKINNLQTQLTNAIADLDANKADKAAFNALKTAFDELKDELMGEDGKIAEIEAAIEALQNGSEAIESQFATYAKFIQSIAYVPATSDGLITVVPYYLTNTSDASYPRLVGRHREWNEEWSFMPGRPNRYTPRGMWHWENEYETVPANAAGPVSQALLVASFKVTPAEAVSRVDDQSADLVAVQTKAAAAAPDTLVITKLVARADAPGYVDVYAIPGDVEFDPNSFAVALSVTQEENDLWESVTSDYAPATMQEEPENIVFQIRDEKDGQIVDPTKNDDPVKVYPSSDPDSVNVFTAGRWSVVANFAGSYLTPDEAKDVFGVKLAQVSPKVGDTIVAAVEANPDYYAWKDYGFESTVWPAGEKKIKDLINSSNDEFQLALNIANSHMVGETFTPSGKVIATYKATPDVVKLALTPEHPVVIPWDYRNPNYKDIADTLIAKIWVAGDRNKLIGTGDAPLYKQNPTWNKDSELDYSEDRVGDVNPHTNDTKAIDVKLISAAEYGKADSTYVYSIQQYKADEATMYVGEFEYVVKARPADVKVELGPVDTVVRFAGDGMVFNVEPIYKAIAAHAEAYAPFDTALVYPDFADRLTKKTPKVELDGKKLDQSATFTVAYDNVAKKDASTLKTKINKVGQYKITIETTYDNIKYTFVLTVNAANNPAKIAPKDAYVTVDNAETKDYSVEIKGDVDTNANAAANGHVRYHYYINDMPFTDYLKVVDYAADSEPLKVNLVTLTKMVSGNTVWAPWTPTELDRLSEDPTAESYTTANLRRDAADNNSHQNFRWDSYDSLQFSVAAILFPVADNTCKVDSATVRLWTKNPIPVFDGGDMLVVEHEKDQLASANITANLNIKDLYGVALNDSTGLRAIGWDANAKEVVVNYDQALSYGNKEDFKLISGAQFIEELDLYWGPTGVLNLRLNQGTIKTPIIIEVPVYLKHMLDRGLKEQNTAWVTVKFIEKETATVGD